MRPAIGAGLFMIRVPAGSLQVGQSPNPRPRSSLGTSWPTRSSAHRGAPGGLEVQEERVLDAEGILHQGAGNRAFASARAVRLPSRGTGPDHDLLRPETGGRPSDLAVRAVPADPVARSRDRARAGSGSGLERASQRGDASAGSCERRPDETLGAPPADRRSLGGRRSMEPRVGSAVGGGAPPRLSSRAPGDRRRRCVGCHRRCDRR